MAQPTGYEERRIKVDQQAVSWHVDDEGYNERVPEWTADVVKANAKGLFTGEGWADPEDVANISDLHKRLTTEGPVQFDERTGAPRNPRGRTGLAGRGSLGKWGPNRAADPIVTRWHPQTNQLQVVAIQRKETGEWALPGGAASPPPRQPGSARDGPR